MSASVISASGTGESGISASFRSDQPAARTDSRGGDMVSVTIAKPPETGLAIWMSHLRDCLDKHRIEPVGFKYHETRGNQIYEVSFRDGRQAALFAAEFDKSTFDNKHQPRTTGHDSSQSLIEVLSRSDPSPDVFMQLAKEEQS